jgi:LPXTG-motif cell wall-anchored protein
VIGLLLAIALNTSDGVSGPQSFIQYGGEVTPPPIGAQPLEVPGGALARTGSNMIWLVLVAAALLVSGLAVVAATKLRRRPTT